MENTKKINAWDRRWFVKFWADYILKNPGKWSSQQNMLIDSQILGAVQLSPRAYLKMKGEICLR